MMKQNRVIDFFILVFSIIFGVFTSLHRLIARDEGFYTFAAELVTNGYIPYIDFFYPQMPILPYIYGLGGLITGIDWNGLRTISGLIFGSILFIAYLIVSKESSRAWGMLTVLLLATCHLSFAWFAVIQTYGLSVLFLLLCLFTLLESSLSKCTALFAGIFISLAISTRLFFAPLIVVPLVYFLSGERKALCKSFIIGGFIGSIPLLLHIIIGPDIFLFNNLGYHLERSSRPIAEELRHKWRIFEVLFSLGRPTEKFSGFQTPIIFLGMFLAPFLTLFRNRSIVITSAIGIIIFIVSFLPTPPYVQYFVAVVPFATISFVLVLHSLSEKITGRSMQITAGVLLCVFCCIYIYRFPGDFTRYTRTGEGVIGVGSLQGAAEWNLQRMKEIEQVILRESHPDDTILSLWPGYLVGVERNSLPGTENHFGLRAGEKLERKKRVRYKVKSIDDLVEVIEAQAVQLVVGYRRSFRGKIRKALKKEGYQQVEFDGLVEVWKAP